jgi:hypothetical protein
MKKETLRVTWKIIRREGHGRTPESYCKYIAENENHKHKLRTNDGSKLFEILDNTVIFKRDGTNYEVFVDGMYDNSGNLLYVTNFRKINNKPIYIKYNTGKFKRNCPLCKKELYYKYKSNRNRANKNKSICRSCSNRIKNKIIL